MTLSEFKNTDWTHGIIATYKNKKYEIILIDYSTKAISLMNEEGIIITTGYAEVYIDYADQ